MLLLRSVLAKNMQPPAALQKSFRFAIYHSSLDRDSKAKKADSGRTQIQKKRIAPSRRTEAASGQQSSANHKSESKQPNCFQSDKSATREHSQMIPAYTQTKMTRLSGFAAREGSNSPESTRTGSLSQVRRMMSGLSRRPLAETLKTLLAEFRSDLLQLLTYSPDNVSPMCAHYGHVVSPGNWGKGLPKCRECGSTIKDPAELRKAQPRVKQTSNK